MKLHTRRFFDNLESLDEPEVQVCYYWRIC